MYEVSRLEFDLFLSEKWNAINMLLTCPTSAADWFNKGRGMCYHVCDNACKKSLDICHKSGTLCPVSRSLSVPI